MSKRFLSFTAFSLVGMLLVSLLLAAVFRHISRSTLENHFLEHNILLARILRNALVDARLEDLLSGSETVLQDQQLLSAFERSLREHLRDLPVAKVKIFNLAGLTVYSSTAGEAGRDAHENPGVVAALLGKAIGSVVHRDSFNSFDGVIEDRELYQQYIPIRAPGEQRAEGAFEIYTDITPLMQDIDRTQRNFMLGLAAIMGGFFLGQLWLYYRTDSALVREKAHTEDYLRQLETNRRELEGRVTERTKELESSRFFLQSVIDGIASPLFVIRPDLRISMMNRAAQGLLPHNVKRETITHCYQISHQREVPCEGENHPCAFHEVMWRHATVTVRHHHTDAQDKPVVLNLVSSPLYGRDGTALGIIEVHHDITELEHAREQLSHSQERLQAILDHVPDAIFTLDTEGRIESTNQAALRLFGGSDRELPGLEFQSLFCDESYGSLLAVEGVRENYALGGQGRFPVDLWVGALSLGKDLRYVAVVRDITERNRAVQELERTRKQYYHQEKMAAIGQLAAGILHEVGNPIAAIAGAAQDMRMAKAQQADADGQLSLEQVVDRNLALIEEHTERLAKITREIAEFASPRPRERELTDINGLIHGTTRLLGYDRRFRGVELRKTLDSQLPAVEAVPDQITQVLMNLLINAMDAASARMAKDPLVEVSSRLAEGGIEIEVRDNGEGMDAQTLEHVMEPFFTTKEPGKGTGLGLSLCDSILTAHGGSLRIDSTLGTGTSVQVFLPENPPTQTREVSQA